MSERSIVQKNFNVPIRCTDVSIFDNDFIPMKEKFNDMMKQMDQEMNNFSVHIGRMYQDEPSADLQGPSQDGSPATTTSVWENITASPLVEDDGVGKTLKLQFDVSNYTPEEISVQVKDNLLLIAAKHEETSNNGSILREYNRRFLLPKGLDLDSIVSFLSREGVLTVEAPLPKLPMQDI